MSVSPRASNLDVEQLFNILNTQDTSFQGSLKKKGRHGMQSWSDRYCVLKGPYLFYYSDPQKNELKGVVNLKNAQIQRNGLDITVTGDQTRPYHLQASSAENSNQWVEYLNRAIADIKKKEDVHRELANAIKLRDTELKQLKETTKRQMDETIAELTRTNDRLKKELEAERSQSEGVKRQIDQLSDQIEQERNRSRSLEAELRNAKGSDSKLEKLQNDLLQEQRRRQACESELKPLQIEVTELRDRLQRTMVQPREQQQDQIMIANLQRELHAIKQSLHSESESRAYAEQNIHEVQALCDKYRKEVTMLRLQIKQQAFTELGKKVQAREAEIINAESWWKPELISIR